MPHDPIRAADTRGWLAKADMDLKAAAHQLTAVSPFTAAAVFHAQQAAEKAMKGFLAWHDAPFRKTHDISPRSVSNVQASIPRWSRCSCARPV